MSDKMVLLAIYGNPVEAELARAELEGAGIRACVLGASSGDLFAGMGVGLSNVQLLVPEEDYERAAGILAEESDVAREARENREREEEAARQDSTAIKEKTAGEASPTEIRPVSESPIQAVPAPTDRAEPVAGEETKGDLAEELSEEAEDVERDESPLTWTPDDMAERAFRAALFGYFTCGVLHLYALWILLYIPFTEGKLSPGGARKAWAALALAIWPPLLVLIVLWRMIS
jgi:hypothetical protein